MYNHTEHEAKVQKGLWHRTGGSHPPFLGFLFAATLLTVVLVLAAQRLRVAEAPVEKTLRWTSFFEAQWMGLPGERYLRQCVMEVFCSTSTDRSRKSSSLLLTCRWSEDMKVQTNIWRTDGVPVKSVCTEDTFRCLRRWILSKINSLWLKSSIIGGGVFGVAMLGSDSNIWLTASQLRQRVSFVRVPWKISWTQVCCVSFPPSLPPTPPPPFCTSLPFCCRSWLFSSWSRSAMVLRR